MLHQTFLFLGQLWQLFEVSQSLEFLRYNFYHIKENRYYGVSCYGRDISSGTRSNIRLESQLYCVFLFNDLHRFCSNLTEINTCIQDSIASCAFDSRVTTFFGESGLGLQASYDSICAHPFSARGIVLWPSRGITQA